MRRQLWLAPCSLQLSKRKNDGISISFCAAEQRRPSVVRQASNTKNIIFRSPPLVVCIYSLDALSIKANLCIGNNFICAEFGDSENKNATKVLPE